MHIYRTNNQNYIPHIIITCPGYGNLGKLIYSTYYRNTQFSIARTRLHACAVIIIKMDLYYQVNIIIYRHCSITNHRCRFFGIIKSDFLWCVHNFSALIFHFIIDIITMRIILLLSHIVLNSIVLYHNLWDFILAVSLTIIHITGSYILTSRLLSIWYIVEIYARHNFYH